MAERRPTAQQRAAEEALLWCRAHGASVQWLDRDRVLCRITMSDPSRRRITVIAPSLLQAYEELRAELAQQRSPADSA